MTAAPTIPLAALENHIVFLAKTGAGKSNGAKTVVEGMLDRGERVCIIDPTGTWYGLRLMPDGKPSPYKVLIFGGNHADVQIGGGDGAAIAEVVGTSATSCIIDTRLLSVADRTKFFTAFAETLLARNIGDLNLVIDEAHLFAPKGKVNDPKSGMMLGATSNLVSLGRGIGLRITMLSQRPAKFHNDCLSCAETLVAMRMLLPADRDAVMAWVKEHADAEQGKQIAASLSSLPTGDAWIWSPQLDLLERRRFPLVNTKDTGRPPRPDEARVDLAPLQIDEITARLEQVAAEILANDPRALKAEVVRLSRELAKALRQAKEPKTPPPVVANADDLAKARAEGEAVGYQDGLGAAANAILALRKGGPAPAAAKARSPVSAFEKVTAEPVAPLAVAAGVDGPGQRLLNALGWWRAFGFDAPTNEQVSFIAGYSPTSGGYKNPRSALKSAGLVDYPTPGCVSLTEAGAEKAEVPARAPTGEELRRRVLAKLDGPQQRILSVVLTAYPEELSNDDAAERAGYSPTSGGYKNPRSSLKTLSAITYPRAGFVRAADWLFP